MTRLRVKELLDIHRLPHTRVAARAGIAISTMVDIRNASNNLRVHVETLDKIAASMTYILQQERKENITITVHDLIDIT